MLCRNPFFRSTVGISKENWDMATPFGCGQCLSCRINQSRVWTHRIMLENRASNNSYYMTLTYDEDNVPLGGLLCKPDLQKYIKRIRKKHEFKIRYFVSGEYGNHPEYRPHYHLILFSEHPMNTKVLDDKWNMGFTQIGDVTTHSAAYVAGYCVKKLTSRDDAFIQEASQYAPEFATQSRKPGIGYPGLEKIAKTLKNNKYFPKDKILKELTIGKKVYPLGRYMMNKLMDLLGQDHAKKGLMFWDYQKELFAKHGHMLDTPGGFIADMYFSDEQKRLSQEKKFKIYSKKRTI